jgi:hypothetical protein
MNRQIVDTYSYAQTFKKGLYRPKHTFAVCTHCNTILHSYCGIFVMCSCENEAFLDATDYYARTGYRISPPVMVGEYTWSKQKED